MEIKNSDLNKSFTPPPSAFSLEKIGSKNEEMEPGDLMWGKVCGHPWWPCVFTPDPVKGLYQRNIMRKSKFIGIEYHVNFFGKENERGWLTEKNLMVFKGKKAFGELMQSNQEAKAKELLTPKKLNSWNLAIGEAEKMMGKNQEDRMKPFLLENELEEKEFFSNLKNNSRKRKKCFKEYEEYIEKKNKQIPIENQKIDKEIKREKVEEIEEIESQKKKKEERRSLIEKTFTPIQKSNPQKFLSGSISRSGRNIKLTKKFEDHMKGLATPRERSPSPQVF